MSAYVGMRFDGAKFSGELQGKHVRARGDATSGEATVGGDIPITKKASVHLGVGALGAYDKPWLTLGGVAEAELAIQPHKYVTVSGGARIEATFSAALDPAAIKAKAKAEAIKAGLKCLADTDDCRQAARDIDFKNLVANRHGLRVSGFVAVDARVPLGKRKIVFALSGARADIRGKRDFSVQPYGGLELRIPRTTVSLIAKGGLDFRLGHAMGGFFAGGLGFRF